MKQKNPEKSIIALLRTSIATLLDNPIIFYPLCINIFIQLIVLEILFFAPRWPLNLFFGPLIRNLWSERYLHYPFNFQLLPELFYRAQIPLYLLIGAFLSAMTIAIVAAINSGKSATLKKAFKTTSRHYVHILSAAIIIFAVVFLLIECYGLIFSRALEIRSGTGPFFMLKSVVIHGRPYFNLLIDVFATTLFIFVLPIIVIEKVKIHKALILNFKKLLKCFWLILVVVLIPTLLFVIVIMLRRVASPVALDFPAITWIMIVFSAFVKLVIEAVVLTAATTYYLRIRHPNKEREE